MQLPFVYNATIPVLQQTQAAAHKERSIRNIERNNAMKKLFTAALCLLMVLSMVACAPAEDPKNEDNGTTTTAPAGTTDPEGTAKPSGSQDKGTPAENWDGKTALEIMQHISQKADTQIMAEVLDGSEFYLNALTLGELEFEEIALYMPMMSSQRFEVAVIRVKEGTNVANFVADLESRAANAQWVCAAPPDYVKVVSVGDCVLYMAINSEFANEEAMVEAFRNPVA